MTELFHRRDDCRFCGGRNLELVIQLEPTPSGGHYVAADSLDEPQDLVPMDIFLCLDCGYTGFLDVISPEFLFNIEVTSMSLGVKEDLQELAEATVARLTPKKDALVVDIGCNDGTLLKAFQQHGLRVLGVEAASSVAALAKAGGVPTVNDYFSHPLAQTIKGDWGSAEIITANRVLANIDDMYDFGEGVRSLLDPEGTFVFETGYLVDILENALLDTMYHEHLGYDTAKALDGFFRKHGLELVDIERIPIKGGSLRGLVQPAGGPRKVAPSVAELIEYEKDLGIDRPEFFKDFSDTLASVKVKLGKLVHDLAAEGKTIAAYGASVGSTTMIYYFGLGDTLSFLADDDPRNQNLFSPGYHIPVFPSEKIYELKPDYMLILAWRYAQPIIKKHQAYLDQGGHFIVPMPEFEIV